MHGQALQTTLKWHTPDPNGRFMLFYLFLFCVVFVVFGVLVLCVFVLVFVCVVCVLIVVWVVVFVCLLF